jgi:hypothetical protein
MNLPAMKHVCAGILPDADRIASADSSIFWRDAQFIRKIQGRIRGDAALALNQLIEFPAKDDSPLTVDTDRMKSRKLLSVFNNFAD